VALTHELPGTALNDAAVRAFRQRVRGSVISSGDAAYDEARRIWNTRYDRRPALVVRPADTNDIVRTVGLAAETALPLAVRSGGHSPAGHGSGDGALVLDLSAMRELSIDAVSGVAWAGPGLTAGEYTAAAHERGLATPFGDTGSVGLGGLTLGGGIGYLVRKHGMTIDNLLSIDVITADGRTLTASADEEPELFWAMRGGGGNFGVATRFEYRLHPLAMVYGGVLVLPATREVVRAFLPVVASAPDELTTIGAVFHAPPMPFLPPETHGKLVFGVIVCYAGDPARGERAVAPLRALATPLADTLGPMPYPALFAFTAEAGNPGPSMVRAMFLRDFSDGEVDAVLEHMHRATSPAAMAQIRVLGGAMARVGDGETAFAQRAQPIMFTIITPFVPPAPAEAHTAWTEGLASALRPRATGAFASFLEEEGPDGVRGAYPPETYSRLAALKRRYDPANLFRLNQNIPPAP
jgi:FAD/FMN-containing dehydrogenase